MMISESSPFTHSLSFDDISRIHQPLSPKNNNSDDVTTIFVVGFPEDMSEREFQNMFTFCRGFEAASLKWHCKDQEDDMLNNGGKKQMVHEKKSYYISLIHFIRLDLLGLKHV